MCPELWVLSLGCLELPAGTSAAQASVVHHRFHTAKGDSSFCLVPASAPWYLQPLLLHLPSFSPDICFCPQTRCSKTSSIWDVLRRGKPNSRWTPQCRLIYRVNLVGLINIWMATSTCWCSRDHEFNFPTCSSHLSVTPDTRSDVLLCPLQALYTHDMHNTHIQTNKIEIKKETPNNYVQPVPYVACNGGSVGVALNSAQHAIIKYSKRFRLFLLCQSSSTMKSVSYNMPIPVRRGWTHVSWLSYVNSTHELEWRLSTCGSRPLWESNNTFTGFTYQISTL